MKILCDLKKMFCICLRQVEKLTCYFSLTHFKLLCSSVVRLIAGNKIYFGNGEWQFII